MFIALWTRLIWPDGAQAHDALKRIQLLMPGGGQLLLVRVWVGQGRWQGERCLHLYVIMSACEPELLAFLDACT